LSPGAFTVGPRRHGQWPPAGLRRNAERRPVLGAARRWRASGTRHVADLSDPCRHAADAVRRQLRARRAAGRH